MSLNSSSYDAAIHKVPFPPTVKIAGGIYKYDVHAFLDLQGPSKLLKIGAREVNITPKISQLSLVKRPALRTRESAGLKTNTPTHFSLTHPPGHNSCLHQMSNHLV